MELDSNCSTSYFDFKKSLPKNSKNKLILFSTLVFSFTALALLSTSLYFEKEKNDYLMKIQFKTLDNEKLKLELELNNTKIELAKNELKLKEVTSIQSLPYIPQLPYNYPIIQNNKDNYSTIDEIDKLTRPLSSKERMYFKNELNKRKIQIENINN